MKIKIFGRNADNLRKIVEKFPAFEESDSPEAIVVFGGDGTLLRAEREWPGVLKVLIRGSKLCKKCPNVPPEEILSRLAAGDFREEELMTLEAAYKNQAVWALNDIVVHNARPTEGIRYKVFINDEQYSSEIVGDGVVVATPFGSGAYYRSITDSVFRLGIGLAFNNSTEQVDHAVLREEDVIKVLITRGEALLLTDNVEEGVPVETGEEVVVKKGARTAKIFDIDNILCDICRQVKIQRDR